MLQPWILVACLQGALLSTSTPSEYYVDLAGNDANTGSEQEPFRTLDRAREEVRKLVELGLTADVTVWIRGGTYVLQKPLVFGPGDAGTRYFSVTYAAYPGERPEIVAGRFVRGWRRGAGGLWLVELPFVRDGGPLFHQLFVGGERRTRSRTPNADFFRMIGRDTRERPFRVRYRERDIRPDWAGTDVQVVALIGGSELRSRIDTVDELHRVATLRISDSPPHIETDPRYWIENDPEGVDSPGEWHLSRATGELTYRPFPGEDLESAEVIAPMLPEIVVVEGDPLRWRFVRNLHFRGLSFGYTSCAAVGDDYVSTRVPVPAGAAIKARGAIGCSVEDCAFSELGGYAVELGPGCKQNRIVGNEMSDLGAGGIRLGCAVPSPNSDEHTSDNTVTDNRIRECGRILPSSPAVWVGHASRTTVSFNEISATEGSAIVVGCLPSGSPEAGRSHQIDSNHLHHIGTGLMGGVAAIRVAGAQPGTTISGNLIHDVRSYKYGGWGIHAGDGCEGVVVEDNLVYGCKGAALSIARARELTVANNIFAMNEESQLVRQGAVPGGSLKLHRNIVCWSQGELLGREWNDGDCVFDRNLYWRTGGREFRLGRWSWSAWKGRGQDSTSRIADPLFVNLSGHDFTLRPESPALELGFEPVDHRAVGPRPKDFRGSIETASARE